MEPRREIEYLQQRISELEEKVEHLRVSRRVLMNLLEKVEREKGGLVTRLEKENKKLQQNNSRFAKSLLSKNRQLIEMQAKINNHQG
ncbi:MAG TPA: translation initiation factor 2 [Verrucomicrobiae bacterium]|nr:translation initiation factor 2 [Verrucomicrobiae bacterium]